VGNLIKFIILTGRRRGESEAKNSISNFHRKIFSETPIFPRSSRAWASAAPDWKTCWAVFSAAAGGEGDLYIKIGVRPHPLYTREGDDLTLDKEIKLSEALLGTTIRVPTLEGGSVSLRIPAGTKSHTKFRLKGYGMPVLGQNRKGDAYVRLMVDMPRQLTKEQKKLIEELQKSGF